MRFECVWVEHCRHTTDKIAQRHSFVKNTFTTQILTPQQETKVRMIRARMMAAYSRTLLEGVELEDDEAAPGKREIDRVVGG